MRAALWIAVSIAGTASAQGSGELTSLINAYRSSAQRCEGEQSAPAGPLAPDPALARVDSAAAGGSLQAALKRAGYQASRVQAITVSGPRDASAAMTFIARQYCRALLNPRYAEIGIRRDGDTWRLVLAQPLLSTDLGDWREAGREVLKLVNAARAEPRSCGNRRFSAAPRASWNSELASTALAHSEDMAKRNYFRHTGKDGSEVGDRAKREGYQWRRIGENIATGQGSPKQVVSGWLSSPGHCANIMDGEFTEMGAAYAVNPDSDTTIYWTQVLGTSR